MTSELVATLGAGLGAIATLVAATWHLSRKLTRLEVKLSCLPCQSADDCPISR